MSLSSNNSANNNNSNNNNNASNNNNNGGKRPRPVQQHPQRTTRSVVDFDSEDELRKALMAVDLPDPGDAPEPPLSSSNGSRNSSPVVSYRKSHHQSPTEDAQLLQPSNHKKRSAETTTMSDTNNNVTMTDSSASTMAAAAAMVEDMDIVMEDEPLDHAADHDNSESSASSKDPLDWVLTNYDPATTKPQSMKEELHRLQVLKSYLILDADREEAFERLTGLASRMFECPIALISLIDLGRQWFLSNRGLGSVRETPRQYSFCAHAIQSKHPLVIVPDATRDFRFRENPFVVGPPHIRFYAGAPLISPEGFKLGTFCICDDKPRPAGLTLEEQTSLHDFAEMTLQELVERRDNLQRHQDPAQLIAYTAHDLLTPLTGVQSSLNYLKQDDHVRDILEEHQLELLTTASNCSKLMIRICQTAIDSIKEDSQTSSSSAASTAALSSSAATAMGPMSSRSGETPPATTAMAELLNNLALIMEPIIKRTPLAMTLAPEVPPVVVCDDLKLFRSSLNLISNAMGRTQMGLVHLRIYVKQEHRNNNSASSTSKTSVPRTESNTNMSTDGSTTAGASGESLVFECTDTGPNVEVEEYQYLFSPSRTQDGDLRLGLSTVATLVKSLDGDYGFHPPADHKKPALSPRGVPIHAATTRNGVGAVFWFSVPLQRPEQFGLVTTNQPPVSVIKSSSFSLNLRHSSSSDTLKQSGLPVMSRTASGNFLNGLRSSGSMKSLLRSSGSSSLLRSGSAIQLGRSGSDRSVGSSRSRLSLAIRNLSQPAPFAGHGGCLGGFGGGGSTNNQNATFGEIVLPGHRKTTNSGIMATLLAGSTKLGANGSSNSSTTGSSSLGGLTRSPSHNNNNNASPLVAGAGSRLSSLAAPIPLSSDRSNINNMTMNNNNSHATNTGAVCSSTDTVGSAVVAGTTARKRRALIIEDTTSVRKMLARVIEKMGLVSEQAVNGLEGLEKMKGALFDFVLCDFLMPVMDGLDCVKQYRQWEQQHRPNFRMVIVGISAHADANHVQKGLAEGMDDFKPKPINPKIIAEIYGSEPVKNAIQKIDDLMMMAVEDDTMAAVPIPNVMDCDPDLGGSLSGSHSRHVPSLSPVSTAAAAASGGSLPLVEMHPGHKRARVDAPQPTALSLASIVTEGRCGCLVASATANTRDTYALRKLEQNRWKVHIVRNGEEAFQLLMIRNWDAVLIDDDLPGLDGVSCMQKFRDWEPQNRVNRQLNTFFVCSEPIPSAMDKRSNVQAPTGFDTVLGKPVEWKELSYLLMRKLGDLSIVVSS